MCCHCLCQRVPRTSLALAGGGGEREPGFIHKINRVVGNLEGQLVLGGDWNQVNDGLIDKNKPSGKSSPRDRAAIHMLAEDLNLVDIWRLVNPREREYTFYSRRHKSHSRIDFFLVSDTLVESVVDCRIGAIALSDHATVESHVDLKVDRAKRGRWRLNTMLLQDESFSAAIREDLKSFFEINVGSTDKISSVWEASKAYIRGKFIAHSSKIRKNWRNIIQIICISPFVI